jgi:hypothetical protein
MEHLHPKRPFFPFGCTRLIPFAINPLESESSSEIDVRYADAGLRGIRDDNRCTHVSFLWFTMCNPRQTHFICLSNVVKSDRRCSSKYGCQDATPLQNSEPKVARSLLWCRFNNQIHKLALGLVILRLEKSDLCIRETYP